MTRERWLQVALWALALVLGVALWALALVLGQLGVRVGW